VGVGGGWVGGGFFGVGGGGVVGGVGGGRKSLALGTIGGEFLGKVSSMNPQGGGIKLSQKSILCFLRWEGGDRKRRATCRALIPGVRGKRGTRAIRFAGEVN